MEDKDGDVGAGSKRRGRRRRCKTWVGRYEWYAVSPWPANNSFEELAPREHLHHNVEILLALVQPLHAYDVRMIH